MLLNKWNFGLHRFAARDESRYSIGVVRVVEDATISTDGHRLTRLTIPKAEAENFPQMEGINPAASVNGGVSLSVEDAKRIEKMLPKKSTIPILVNAALDPGEVKAETVKVGMTDLETPQVLSCQRQTGQFPNWEIVIPKDEPVLTIDLDAKLLGELLDYVAKFDDREHRVKLTLYNQDKAIRLDAHNDESGQDFMGLLMPLRRIGLDK